MYNVQTICTQFAAGLVATLTLLLLSPELFTFDSCPGGVDYFQSGGRSEEWQMLRPVSHSLEQCWRGLEQMWRSARAFTLTRLATQPCPDSGEALPTALFADP